MSGRPCPRPGAEHAAGAHAEQALHELVAVAGRRAVANGCSQMSTRVVHVAERASQAMNDADEEQRHADEQPGGALGGDVEHRRRRCRRTAARCRGRARRRARAGWPAQATRIGPRSRPRGRSMPSDPAAGEREHVALDAPGSRRRRPSARAWRARRAGTRSRPSRIQIRAPLMVAADDRAAAAAAAGRDRRASRCRCSAAGPRWSRTTHAARRRTAMTPSAVQISCSGAAAARDAVAELARPRRRRRGRAGG